MVILGGGTQDVEQQEVSQPLLYLWRREVPDSGGAGRHRGGNGIEFAMTPIDTDQVVGVMATHGTTLPNRTGIFGGLPGSCARFEMVHGSRALDELAAGGAISDLRDVQGTYEELPGVSSGLEVSHGEIVNVRLQNGGGYGDPILRDPDAVLRDVTTGAVSVEVAKRVYGVIVSGDSLDAEATEACREAIRESRRSAMEPPSAPSSAPSDGRPSVSGRWGESLRLRATDQGTVAHCAHCNAELGALGDDWQELTGTVTLSAEDLGPLVQLPEALVGRQYICPSCATALWVEVLPADGGWTDFRLSATLPQSSARDAR
jgi:N-methylhydantoinase B